MSNIPEHLKRYIRNQITVDEDALIKLLQDKDKEIERLKGLIEKVVRQSSYEYWVDKNPSMLTDEEINKDWQQFKTENQL